MHQLNPPPLNFPANDDAIQYDEALRSAIPDAEDFYSLDPQASICLCDDCGKWYAGRAYYTFDGEDCFGDNGDHDCTGNLCPMCCGIDISPDDPDDVRLIAMQLAHDRFERSMKACSICAQPLGVITSEPRCDRCGRCKDHCRSRLSDTGFCS